MQHALRATIVVAFMVQLGGCSNHSAPGTNVTDVADVAEVTAGPSDTSESDAVNADAATSPDGADSPDGQVAMPTPVEPEASAMALSFRLVSDSGGKVPAAGTTVTLTLEPPQTAHLLVFDHTTHDLLGFDGTYALGADPMAPRSLTLSFTDPDFTRSGTMAIDVTTPTVSLSFQVFSADAGTSTWNARTVELAENAQDLFEALSATAPQTSLEDRAAQVLAYAERYVAAHADIAASSLRAERLAPKADFLDFGPFIISTHLSSDGSQLDYYYSDGSHATVILFNAFPASTAHLITSPLANDPRLTNTIVSPQHDDDDPSKHTALFIAPFDAKRYYAYWLGVGMDSWGTTFGFHELDKLDSVEGGLEDAGYTVTAVKDNAATVENIVAAFGHDTVAPGLIYLSTHGNSDGELATGQLLDLDEDRAEAKLDGVFNDLRAHGLGGLVDYDRDPAHQPVKTLSYMCVTRAEVETANGTTSKLACYVSLTPKFFEWLRFERGVVMSTSLVMVSACLTDQTSALREAVGARTYFAYNVSASGRFAGAVFQYFAASLARHTHTAEESFYNVLRIANSRQMIYPEDAIFQDIVNVEAYPGLHSVQSAFRGYFLDDTQALGANMVNYLDVGWLHTPNANPGSIWMLLFAGRWGGDTKVGSSNLLFCWKNAWKAGQQGDNTTWCRDAAPGYAPTEAEVSYANYLLTGNPSGDGLTAVEPRAARWTLNDGRAP